MPARTHKLIGLSVACALVLSCDNRSFWEYFQAGVLTTPDLRRYLVVNPCLEEQYGGRLDSIELDYAPRVVLNSNEKAEYQVVIKYRVDPNLPLNEVAAPIDPEENPPPGIELEFVDKELLEAALKSGPSTMVSPSSSSDELVTLNAYYVYASGEGEYVGTWNSSLDRPDSFAAGDQARGNIESDGCDAYGHRLHWVVPPPPDVSN